MDTNEYKEEMRKAGDIANLYLCTETMRQVFCGAKAFVQTGLPGPPFEFLDQSITVDDFLNERAVYVVENFVVQMLVPVYIYYDNPLLCAKWLKGRLKATDLEFSNYLLKSIKLILNDPQRFPQKWVQLNFLKQELETFDRDTCDIPPINHSEGMGWISFFCGPNGFQGKTEGSAVEDLLKARLSIAGMIATEEEVVREFLSENMEMVSKLLPTYFLKETLPLDAPEQVAEAPAPFEGKVNKFNKMSLPIVYRFFKQMTTEKNIYGHPFLSEKQLQAFINRAFCFEENIPKQTINISPKGENLFLWRLFYFYYSICINDYEIESTKQCRRKYIELLSDNFTNWSYKSINDNISKSTNNSGRKWPMEEIDDLQN